MFMKVQKNFIYFDFEDFDNLLLHDNIDQSRKIILINLKDEILLIFGSSC
jgi:hypothetical protein